MLVRHLVFLHGRALSGSLLACGVSLALLEWIRSCEFGVVVVVGIPKLGDDDTPRLLYLETGACCE